MRTAAPFLLGFLLLLACGAVIAPVDAGPLQGLRRNTTAAVGLDGSPTPNSTADRQATEEQGRGRPGAPRSRLRVASSVDDPERNDRRISELEARQANIDTQLAEMRAELKVDMARERDGWQATHAHETRELRHRIRGGERTRCWSRTE